MKKKDKMVKKLKERLGVEDDEEDNDEEEADEDPRIPPAGRSAFG